MNQSKFAKEIGVSRQAVSKMKKEGLLIFKNGKIDKDASIKTLEKLGRLKKGKKIDREIKEEDIQSYTSLKNSYLAERIRKEKIENDKREGILIELRIAKQLAENFLQPISTSLDQLSQSFKTRFPEAEPLMIEYLENYIQDIKTASQINEIPSKLPSPTQ